MAHNDAREVERQYYEFRERMAKKRTGSPSFAPVKKAAPVKGAPAKAPVKSAQKSVPPRAEEHIDDPMTTRLVRSAPIKPVGPAIEEITPVEEAVLHVAEPAAPEAQPKSEPAPVQLPVTEAPAEEILPPAEEPEAEDGGEDAYEEIAEAEDA